MGSERRRAENKRYVASRDQLHIRLRHEASPTTAAMLGPNRGSGCPSEPRGWPHSVPWRLGGFFFLLLLEGACCLASPGPDSHSPAVNVYMSVEEVKKLLGKACRQPGSSLSPECGSF